MFFLLFPVYSKVFRLFACDYSYLLRSDNLQRVFFFFNSFSFLDSTGEFFRFVFIYFGVSSCALEGKQTWAPEEVWDLLSHRNSVRRDFESDCQTLQDVYNSVSHW